MKKACRLVASNFPTCFKCGAATSAKNLKGSSVVDLCFYPLFGTIKDIFYFLMVSDIWKRRLTRIIPFLYEPYIALQTSHPSIKY
jgi:hypothetical protein